MDGRKGLAEPVLALTVPENPSNEDDGSPTGPGEEALSGLAHAFLYAGSRALLVSHWPVQSSAAIYLTTRALAELGRSPKIGRSEALWRAMLASIDKGRPH